MIDGEKGRDSKNHSLEKPFYMGLQSHWKDGMASRLASPCSLLLWTAGSEAPGRGAMENTGCLVTGEPVEAAAVRTELRKVELE